MNNKSRVIAEVEQQLAAEQRDQHWQVGQHIYPSADILEEAMKLIAEVIFPEYLIDSSREIAQHRVALNLERIYNLMHDQIARAIGEESEELTAKFITTLSDIKHLLATDVEAIYKADPAAGSYGEIVLCYPSIVAMTYHRIAHSLHKLGIPIIPRVISEIAHSKSGIDIHPGATIGSHFAIDHGTGVVIGETTIIGKGVVVYQGVTLGAKGFRFDENGNALNIPRHPIIEDNVRIYSNSSILGRITIGHDAVIGGNMWIDKDIEPHSCMVKLR